MPKRYTPMQIDSQIHDRLVELRAAITSATIQGEAAIGIGVTIGLLLDHWHRVPPDLNWLKEEVRKYPRRGRPRRSEESAPLVIRHGKKDAWKGHDFVPNPARPQVLFCKQCQYWWDTGDWPMPLHPCYIVKPTPGIKPGRFTKSELISLGWPEDAVEWGADG